MQSALCPWTESVIHRFTGLNGIGPVGAVVFDQTGNLYGATSSGGLRNGGTVFELSPSGGGWTTRLFTPRMDIRRAESSSIAPATSLGTAFIGGNGQGSVYQLTPSGGGGWISSDLYDFTNGNDGGFPWAGLILDQAGNLYGSTSTGGAGAGGTVFQLVPSNGNWTLNTLHSFTGPGNGRFVVGPVGSLVMDNAGALYGTALSDGANVYGSVFKLAPSNGAWIFTSLHDFTGGSDGGYPYSNLVFDAHGNIYGTASVGGTGQLAPADAASFSRSRPDQWLME